MSKMGEEDSVFFRLLIQGTSTKNFYFIPSPQSAVRVLYLVHVLYPVRIFKVRVLYLVRILYPVRSPHVVYAGICRDDYGIDEL